MTQIKQCEYHQAFIIIKKKKKKKTVGSSPSLGFGCIQIPSELCGFTFTASTTQCEHLLSWAWSWGLKCFLPTPNTHTQHTHPTHNPQTVEVSVNQSGPLGALLGLGSPGAQ